MQVIDSQYLLAGDPQTSSVGLSVLASLDVPGIRARVGENPSCPPAVMCVLLGDSDSSVRLSLTRNPNVSMEILDRLATDPSADVAYAMADNYKLPLVLLERLAKHEIDYVAERAIRTIALRQGSWCSH